MTRPFVIVITNDWGFRSCCQEALVAAGYRVATPTRREGAEYFLASAYPPDVVVFWARERWSEALGEAVRHAPRPPAVAVIARCPDERLGGARPAVDAVRHALEELASRPNAWRDALTLGVESLDAPHRAAFALLNAFESAVRAQGRHEALGHLEQLQRDAQSHFAREDSIMQLHGYSSRDEHAREHARLLEEIRELAARYAGDSRLGADVTLSLRDWLEGHIMTLDRALADHLGRDGGSRRG